MGKQLRAIECSEQGEGAQNLGWVQRARGPGRGHRKNPAEESGWSEALGHQKHPEHLGSVAFPRRCRSPEMALWSHQYWLLLPVHASTRQEAISQPHFSQGARPGLLSYHFLSIKHWEGFQSISPARARAPTTPGGHASHWKHQRRSWSPPHHTVGTHGRPGAC